jgi:hypothetical protein
MSKQITFEEMSPMQRLAHNLLAIQLRLQSISEKLPTKIETERTELIIRPVANTLEEKHILVMTLDNLMKHFYKFELKTDNDDPRLTVLYYKLGLGRK